MATSANINLRDGLSVQEYEALSQMDATEREALVEDQLGHLSDDDRAAILKKLKADIEKVVTEYDSMKEEISAQSTRGMSQDEKEKRRAIKKELGALIRESDDVQGAFDSTDQKLASRHVDMTDGQDGSISPETDGGIYVADMGGTVGGANPFGGETTGETPRQTLHVDVPLGAEVEFMGYNNGAMIFKIKSEDGESFLQVRTDNPDAVAETQQLALFA